MSIYYFPGVNMPATQVLEGAKRADLDEVVVIGYGSDGLYISSSEYSISEINLMLDRAKQEIMLHLMNAEAQ